MIAYTFLFQTLYIRLFVLLLLIRSSSSSSLSFFSSSTADHEVYWGSERERKQSQIESIRREETSQKGSRVCLTLSNLYHVWCKVLWCTTTWNVKLIENANSLMMIIVILLWSEYSLFALSLERITTRKKGEEWWWRFSYMIFKWVSLFDRLYYLFFTNSW